MNAFQITQEIEAPVDRVFQKATAFSEFPNFIDGITKIEWLTEGEIGRGAKFRETRRIFGKEASEVMTITEWEPPALYVTSASGSGCVYRTEFRFTASDGRSRIDMTFSATPQNWMAKLLARMMAPMIKQCKAAAEADLRDIKAVAEARS